MEGLDLLDSDIVDVHVGDLDPQTMMEQSEKAEHMAKIDSINRKIRNKKGGNSTSRSRERASGAEGGGLNHSLSQRAIKLSNYQNLMLKQKKMSSEHSLSASAVPRLMSVQEQYKQLSQDRRPAEPDPKPSRPRTNTEFQ